MKSAPGNIQDIQKLANPTPPAVVAATLPAVATDAGWGAMEELDSRDLLIPKIYHMQGLSKLVSEGIARTGDFCDSLTNEVLCKKENPLEVIVFGLFKTMVISKEQPGGKYKLAEIVRINKGNAHNYANLPFVEETREGRFKNNLYYNYYVLLPGKIADLPYILSLGSTKTKVAQKLGTMLTKLDQQGKPGASVVFELRSTMEKNDQGTWAGLEITQGRPSTKEELIVAHTWYMKSKTQNLVATEEAAESDGGDDIPY